MLQTVKKGACFVPNSHFFVCPLRYCMKYVGYFMKYPGHLITKSMSAFDTSTEPIEEM